MKRILIKSFISLGILSLTSFSPAKSETDLKNHSKCISATDYSSCINDRLDNQVVRDMCHKALDYIGCMKHNSKINNAGFTKVKKKRNLNLASNSGDKLDKGYYLNVGFGVGKYSNVNLLGTNQSVNYQTGLSYEIGVGYDFGNRYRAEVNYAHTSSDIDTILGANASSDVDINALTAMGYIDFEKPGKWDPFIGAGLGLNRQSYDTICTAGTCSNGSFTSFASLALAIGTNYEMTQNQSITAKYSYNYFPKIKYSGVNIHSSSTSSFLIGYKYMFN